MVRKLLFISIIWIAFGFLMGCDTGTLEGHATDPCANEPVAGAQVVLVGTQFSAVTDSSGHYLIDQVPINTSYEVVITHSSGSFTPNNVSFSLSEPGEVYTIDFSLVCQTGEVGELHGHAMDPCANEPIAGAEVVLAGTNLSAVTDSSGYYHIGQVNIDTTYDVQITHPNGSFFPDTASFSLSEAGEVHTIDFSGLSIEDAWKNETQGLTYVSLSGTPTQIGCQHGIMLREELVAIRQMAEDYNRLPGNVNDLIEPWLDYFLPKEIAEMQAIAHATGVANAGNPEGDQAVTFEEVVFFNVQVDMGAVGNSHCSGFAAHSGATLDGKLYQGFNWDSDSGTATLRTQNSVLAFYHPIGEEGESKNNFVAPIMVGSIGVYTGMNSEHIALDTQAASGITDGEWDDWPDRQAFRPATSLIRRALEDADTINEMVDLLTTSSRDDTYTYRFPGLIAIITRGTANENEMVSLEVVGIEHKARNPENDVIYSANTFLSPDWPINGVGFTGTNTRLDGYERLLSTNNPWATKYGDIDVDTSIEIMGYQGYQSWFGGWIDQPICNQYGNGTSLVYVPEDGHIYVSTIGFPPACQGVYIGFDLEDQEPL